MANRGRFQESFELRERAIDIGQRRLGPSNTFLAQNYTRLGNDYHFGLRAFDQSERAFLAGLGVVPKDARFHRAELRQSYGELLLEVGRHLEAESLIEAACVEARDIYRKQTPRCVTAQIDLACIRFRKYDFDGAKRLMTPEALADAKTIERSQLRDTPRAKIYDEMAAF